MSYMILMVLIGNFTINFLSVFFKLKLKKDVLGCGLVGYCGAKPADPAWIKLIMFYNMDRGKDSTGWAVNNKIQKDTETVAKFIQNHSLDISEDNENYTIIAHARASSSGTKMNKELAHPFGMYKGGIEKDKYDLILAMNGTLQNTEVIADKFGVVYKEYTNSDTQTMAKIMANLGEKEYIRVIEGYMGTATLLFFSPKWSNTLMVYKDPQRPLFYWQKEKDEMYISSLEEPLMSLGALKENIKSFEDEHIYRINKGKITKDEKVARLPLKPKAKEIPFHTNNRSGDYYYDQGGTYNPRREYYEKEREKNENKVSSLIGRRGESKYHEKKGAYVYTIADKYYRNGHTLSGKFNITSEGKVKDDKINVDTPNIRTCFFINGFLCRNEEHYNAVVKRCSDGNENVFNLSKFKTIYLSELVDHFENPIITIVNSKEQWVLGEHWKSKVNISGDRVVVDMFLSNESYVLRFEGKWIPTTKKEVCELEKIIEKGSIKKEEDFKESKSSLEDVKKGFTKKQNFDFIDKSIDDLKNNPIQSCQYYYALIRKELWRQNVSEPIREYFFLIFLELLYTKNVINTDSYNDMKLEGKKGYYGAVEWLKEVDKCLDIYIRSLKEKENVNWSRKDNESVQKFTDEELVKSIHDNCQLCKDNKFTEDVLDAEYPTFDSILIPWVNIETTENIRAFCEAILLVFNYVGFLTNKNTIELIYQTDIHDLKTKCSELYLSWKNTLKLHVNEAKKIIGNEPIEFEVPTVESNEEDMKTLFNEAIEGLQDALQQSEIIEEELKSKWVKKAEIDIGDSIRFLKEKLFGIKREKLAHNE